VQSGGIRTEPAGVDRRRMKKRRKARGRCRAKTALAESKARGKVTFQLSTTRPHAPSEPYGLSAIRAHYHLPVASDVPNRKRVVSFLRWISIALNAGNSSRPRRASIQLPGNALDNDCSIFGQFDADCGIIVQPVGTRWPTEHRYRKTCQRVK